MLSWLFTGLRFKLVQQDLEPEYYDMGWNGTNGDAFEVFGRYTKERKDKVSALEVEVLDGRKTVRT